MNTIINSNPYIEPIKKFLTEHKKNPQICTYCARTFKFCSLSLEEEKSEDQKECEKDIDNLAVTRCFHIFHKNCLEDCLSVVDGCPICLEDTITVTLRNSTLRGITAFNLLLVQPKNNQEVDVSSSGETEEVIIASENPNNGAIVDDADTLAEFTPTKEVTNTVPEEQSSDAILDSVDFLTEYTSEEEEEEQDVPSYSSQLPDIRDESNDLPTSESKKRKRPNIDSSIKSDEEGKKQDPRSTKKLKTGEEFSQNAYEEDEFDLNAFASDNESDGSEKEVNKNPSNSPSSNRCLIS